MPDDPLDRLADLGPTAEPREALPVVHRIARRRHRARVTGVAMSLLLIVGITTTLLIRRSNDERVTTDHGEDLPPIDEDGTATARQGDLEITVTVPGRQLVVGERTPVEVVVRNLGATVVRVAEVGKCSGPGHLEAPGVWASVPTMEQVRDEDFPEPERWNGTDALGDHLLHGDLPLPPGFINEGKGLPFEQGCDLMASFSTIAPGQELPWSGTVDVLVGPHPLDRATVVAGAGGPGGSAGPVDVEVEMTLRLVDAPSRLASVDDAVAAFAADPRLAAYLDEGRALIDQPELTQSWTTHLQWHFGAWELWLQSHWGHPSPLRLRYDPTTRSVVDARKVAAGLAPEDDPDIELASLPPGYPHDEVIPLP